MTAFATTPPLLPSFWTDESGGISLPIARPGPTPMAGLVFAAAALMIVGWQAASKSELIINMTPSLPLGIYRLAPLPAHLHDGDTIYFCPPSASGSPAMRQAVKNHWLLRYDRSPCPDHLAPFLKRVAALPGQSVTLSMRGISIDGKLLPKTRIQPRSKTGGRIIHYPLGSYTVKPNTFWETDNSSRWAYDSRYYGPVPMGNLLNSAQPVLTW